MLKTVRILSFTMLFVLIGGSFAFSQTRYALVIGNGRYTSRDVSDLVNPVNDATDVASSLQNLGYRVTLKTNIGLREMLDAITDFAFDLRRSSDNEGFFWFAGHGLSVRGIHYLLPVDVDPVNENIIARGSYSVDDLMEEIANARNRTNLVVIDACRNTLLPGNSNRTVGTRGLSVLSADDYRIAGNKIVYSTMAGRTAADGVPGSRNSPFAQAFITYISNPELFDDVFLDIANETLRLTRGEQQPYSMGSFAVKSYSLNPVASQGFAQTSGQTPVYEVPSRPQPQQPIQTSGGKAGRKSETRFWSIGGSLSTCFGDPWLIGTIRGTIAPINYTFFEFGLDAGTFSNKSIVKGSLSMYPYVNAAFFYPINQKIGVYAGLGGGFMFNTYFFKEANSPVNSNFFAMNIVTGVNFFNRLDVSYTFRTSFKRVGSKLSVGYTHRFDR